METNQAIWVLETGRCPQCNDKAVLMEKTEYERLYYCTNTKCLMRFKIQKGFRESTLFYKILAFWIWIMVDWLKPFLSKNHPWKEKTFTLEGWARNATNKALALGLIQWFNFIAIVVCLFYIL